MSATLFDHFAGNALELYELVKTEVSTYGIPNLEFATDSETAKLPGGSFFKGAKMEEAPCLVVHDGFSKVNILAYSFGENFYVGTIDGFASTDAYSRYERDALDYLEEVRRGCFIELVNRALNDALAKYLESKGRAAPPSLNPAQVFRIEP